MFGYRTPAKRVVKEGKDEGSISPSDETEKAGPSIQNIDLTQTCNVRKSIGDWEAARTEENTTLPKTSSQLSLLDTMKVNQKALPQQEKKEVTTRKRASIETANTSPKTEKPKFANRVAEAKACITKAKLHLGNSRNLRTDIKTEVTLAIERLFQLVKEGEAERNSSKISGNNKEQVKDTNSEGENYRNNCQETGDFRT
ncbi:hypothetical protein PYW08_001366 [Mythimna loreyi]|uniref:Uncharacterized protein n=1 Tax=Mythimna loreyi TaxID=667449 RepID=A0ACC2R401_9NEOP|nr:hypothetical protein PYW08_001366 [Mythimna loreyi]